MENLNQRKHYPTSFFSSLKIWFWFFYEMISHIPEIYSLRKFYKSRKKDLSNPSVALVGDNLDEVNGIAINTRTMVRVLNRKGRSAYLMGIAFHTKKARIESPGTNIFMIPGRRSMDLPGYRSIEIAVPKIGLALRLLKRNPIDLVELETPNPMGFTALIIAKLVGIKTVIHYRTDLLSYFKILIHNKPGVWAAENWTTLFTRFAGPVIVPSNAFRVKVQAMGIPTDKIFKLPRGVDLTMFHPDKSSNGAWEKCTPNYSGTRIIYLGRVSTEKNLQVLVDSYPELIKKRPDVNLTIIGDGPFLEHMKSRLKHSPNVSFPGFLRGNDLAGVIAAADLMVFPSTTDTFGNTVLEALASGVPCIVSDQGGPQEIIEDGKNGLVFNSNDIHDFLKKILFLIDNPDKLELFKKAARERAMQFTHDRSADKFWEFYCKMVREN